MKTLNTGGGTPITDHQKRIAGPDQATATIQPTLLLLHGFPTAGHMFRDLIPLLADRFHLVAPDLPGFGQSDLPARDAFKYTFDNLAQAIDRFTDVIGLKRFAIYIFDYGAPVGLRIALKHPERIAAIVSQNGNAYEEGLSEAWNPIRTYWREPSQANREALRSFLSPETTVFQYTREVADPSVVSPDGRSLDDHYLARPGAHEAQLDLLLDYASNVALYPQFQAYFRKHQPPLLAVWGKNDPFFYLPVRKRSGGIILGPRSTFIRLAISPWKLIVKKLRLLFATSSVGFLAYSGVSH